MRLLYTFTNAKQGRSFSSFLNNEGIANNLEVVENRDWGSEDYGTVSCNIWILEEDNLEKSARWLNIYLENPNDPRFYEHSRTVESLFSLKASENEEVKQKPSPPVIMKKMTIQKVQTNVGFLTSYFLILCCLLFFISAATQPKYEAPPEGVPLTPLYSSIVKKALFYDYPHAFDLIDKIVKVYGIEKLQNPQELPLEGQYLLKSYFQTPYWHGIYGKVVNSLRGIPNAWDFTAPMFEKIGDGEIWRLFSPALLHNDIFHLFFNMIWLFVLGKQMEEKLGFGKYLLFILVAGIFSNTAQYLMSGANFIGFSGVLCAMITFVWMRQKLAAWEGYQLLPSTMAFITIFIVAMFGLQLFSFSLEVAGKGSVAPGIANTAHLSGAAVGLLLGRFKFFSWKK